ncbi:AAA family ATPase [Umezawaea endophytica]|uniref:AAA family ATPase n=1 Tax=Umezawaea endophytica TaxID=1654476 RepID=A0A9X3AFF0_9PSEU|nr:LuxR family transcriptional regulator [Umezawaea endophytica]MCS7477105.1 AAA family ATPase [Umezawaea endophytica]
MTGLVERDTELHALRELVLRVEAGHGGLAMVEAGAGLGKTVLLRHLRGLAADHGCVVLSARGAELERDFAFGVVRQLLEPVLPRDDLQRQQLFRGAARVTEALFGSGDGQAAPGSPFPLLNGLYWLLVNLAERGPLVVLVDDAQWADQPSLRFLGFLARRLDSIGILVTVTIRSVDHGDDELVDDLLATDNRTLLRPRNLSAQGVADLVRSQFGPGAHEEFCAACHAVTGGNPLFVRELLRVLVSDGVRPDAEHAATVTAAGPGAVHWYVAARLRRQSAAMRSVARAVAVLGNDSDLPVVAAQAQLTWAEAAAAARRLTGQGIFERADPPAFVHAVVRDVALSLIPVEDRAAEHERAATVLLGADKPVAQVASHLLRTAPAGMPDRIATLAAAAGQAFQHGSPETAAVFLARARTEPPPPALRAEISRRLGNCQAHHLAIDDAEARLREALALADAGRQRALCAYSLARFLNGCGDPQEAIPLLCQALDDLEGVDDPALLLEVEAELVGMARADLAGHTLVLRHLDSFDRRPGRSRAVLDSQRALEAVFTGRPADEAIRLARSALAGDALTPERCGLWSAVHTMIVADQLDEAERRTQRALDTAVDRGLLFPMGIIRCHLARIALLRGDLAQAAEHVELGTAAVPRPNIGLPALDSTAIHLLVERGRLAEADAVLTDSALAGGRPARSSVHLWLLEARIRLRLAQGDHAAALADSVACGRLLENWGAGGIWDVPWRLLAAHAHRLAGNHQEGSALAHEQLRLARDFAVPRHIAVALRATAEFAAPADQRRQLAEAADLLRGGPGRLELVHVLVDLGAAQQRDGDREQARTTVRRAAELAAECHAGELVERLRAGQAAAGGRLPRLRLTGLHALTPSERRVAKLAADALTNREIAERLFVSEKTVEAHLSSTFRKLGVRSRTQLVTRMTAIPAGG